MRHRRSQNAGVLYTLVDESMVLVDEFMVAVDTLTMISFRKCVLLESRDLLTLLLHNVPCCSGG